MKLCSQCGTAIQDDAAQFCNHCGAPLSFDTSTSASENPVAAMPMKWYKFLIYFSLFAGAVLNAANAITLLTGSVYLEEGITADEVYSIFPMLKAVDLIYGLCMLALAVFAIITRYSLAKYKANGPKLIVLLYVASLVVSLIYCVGYYFATDINLLSDSSNVVSIAVSAAMIAINYNYFSKRKHFFVN